MPFLSCWRVSATSTRSPGSTKPATPSTSLTRTVTAFIPSAMTADSVARWPGPVIFDARIGSFASIAVSTTRRPFSEHVGNLAESAGRHGALRPGNLAQRHRAELVAEAQRLARDHDGLRRDTVFFCASRLRRRISAWLLSHDCAMKHREQAEQRRRSRSSRWCWSARRYPFGLRAIFRRLCRRHIGTRVVLNW